MPFNNLKELAAYAKQNPGKLSFASSASGQQLAGELFKLTAGVDIVHIPYKGAGPAVLDLLGGNVNLMVSNPTSVVPHVKSGKLRALGVLGAKRIDALPDVPAAAESGYPELATVNEWYGVIAPAATPRRGGRCAQRRHPARAEVARRAAAPAGARHECLTQHARGIRQADTRGLRAVGQGRETVRREGRLNAVMRAR